MTKLQFDNNIVNGGLAFWASYSVRMERFQKIGSTTLNHIRLLSSKHAVVWCLPLCLAAARNRHECVRALVEAKASCCKRSVELAAKTATTHDSLESLQHLFTPETPLAHLTKVAARHGSDKCLRFVLQHGGDILPKAFHLCKAPSSIEIMVEQKADINCLSPSGRSFLHKKCAVGTQSCRPMIQTLLRLKADPMAGIPGSPCGRAAQERLCRQVGYIGRGRRPVPPTAVGQSSDRAGAPNTKPGRVPDGRGAGRGYNAPPSVAGGSSCAGWKAGKSRDPISKFFAEYPGLYRFVGCILVTYYTHMDRTEIRNHNAWQITQMFGGVLLHVVCEKKKMRASQTKKIIMFIDTSQSDQSLHTGLYIAVSVLTIFSVSMVVLFGIRQQLS